MRAAQRAAQEVSREAANKKSLLFLDPCSALKQGCEPAGWGEPWLQIQSQALGRLAGLARAESWLAPSPSMLGFPFGFKSSLWSQTNKLEASCVKTVWGETWSRAVVVSWDVTAGDDACRRRRKKKIKALGWE